MTKKRFELAWENFEGWAIYDTTGEYSDDEDYIDWLSGQKAVDVLNHFADENKQLKYQTAMLQEELEQCKAVINNKWSEYLQKKEKELME